MKKKLWFAIFTRVAVIFICTLLIILAANETLLFRYYLHEEKRILRSEMKTVEQVDVTDTQNAAFTLSDISDAHNIEVEIYTEDGTILYTTQGGKLYDFMKQKDDRFQMSRRPMQIISSTDYSDGTSILNATDEMSSEEYLLCQKQISDGVFAELRVTTILIENSAEVAGRFILIIAGVCFLFGLLWIYFFARKFSSPISKMTEITDELSSLDFTRRVPVNGDGEISLLAGSVNHMADSLSAALTDLRSANSRLKGEIELERNLDKMRKQFVANVSHELKTPISIIGGYAEGLKENINEKKRREYCDIILDESERMNRLVLSILELSKYESGQIPVSPERVEVKEVTDCLLARIFKDSKEITVQNQIADGTAVFADPVQFEQAIKSYLENARSHTENGGTVSMTAEPDGNEVCISVYNTGVQIENEKMPLIWQSFYRGDTSHKRDGGRFGLGLSIVSAVAKLHGTRCGVHNTNDGVCFFITFKALPFEQKPEGKQS